MTQPLTTEQLDAIRERRAKATPGPWRFYACTAPVGEMRSGWVHGRDAYADVVAKGMLAHDATFIAHAPSDIDALLAEVERLRAENERPARLLRLPIDLPEIGGIHVERGAAGNGAVHARGHYDPETKRIVVDESCSPIGEAAVLIHEMMHAAECALIDAGVFKRSINHQFIHAAAFGAALALARAGALRGVDDEAVHAFLREAGAE